jgi:hypothetical protein
MSQHRFYQKANNADTRNSGEPQADKPEQLMDT